jgi:hypothetical protein
LRGAIPTGLRNDPTGDLIAGCRSVTAAMSDSCAERAIGENANLTKPYIGGMMPEKFA